MVDPTIEIAEPPERKAITSEAYAPATPIIRPTRIGKAYNRANKRTIASTIRNVGADPS